MAETDKKNLIVRLDPDMHHKLKVYVTAHQTTLQDYVFRLIQEDQERQEQKKK